MLVNPEIYAWLNRQNKPKTAENKSQPRVTPGESAAQGGGSERAPKVQIYAQERTDQVESVDYLNERNSKLNFYA